MPKLLENIAPKIKKIEEILGLSIKIFMITIVIVIFMGVYVANLIYGNNSLHVLKRLQAENRRLKIETSVLKQENAKLHKEYLEWTDAKE
jgi:cell division protein FtsB